MVQVIQSMMVEFVIARACSWDYFCAREAKNNKTKQAMPPPHPKSNKTITKQYQKQGQAITFKGSPPVNMSVSHVSPPKASATSQIGPPSGDQVFSTWYCGNISHMYILDVGLTVVICFTPQNYVVLYLLGREEQIEEQAEAAGFSVWRSLFGSLMWTHLFQVHSLCPQQMEFPEAGIALYPVCSYFLPASR